MFLGFGTLRILKVMVCFFFPPRSFVVSRAGITLDGMSGLLNKEAGRSLTDAACLATKSLLLAIHGTVLRLCQRRMNNSHPFIADNKGH